MRKSDRVTPVQALVFNDRRCQTMAIEHWFNNIHGKGAVTRLRSILADSRLTYQDIGSECGLSRQRIAQLAVLIGINGRQRQRRRTLTREPRIINQFDEYSSGIRAIIGKMKRAGLQVRPYNSSQRNRPNTVRRSLKMFLVNGVLCRIELRRSHKNRPTGREYVRFDVTRENRMAKIALWATRSGRRLKLYVIPATELKNVLSVYIPAAGKYAVGNSKKPRKDWTRFESAWHLLG
jgi:hypothetical protein